jgi:phosphoenolpyruvate-protein phosphotransferase (PTS system enzyme I)
MASTEAAQTSERDFHLPGIGVSKGVAVGRVLRLDGRDMTVGLPAEFEATDVRAETARLRSAVATARGEILELKERVARELGRGHAYFFEAHLLMLEDRDLLRDVERVIRGRNLKAEWAIKVVMDRMLALFAQAKDEYLRERRADVEDVGYRVLRALKGEQGAEQGPLQNNVVIVATDLPPLAMAELDLGHVIAFATDEGGFTSHTAIIARSLGIPAVVGLHDVTSRVSSGDRVAVDGSEGFVILNPTKPVIRRYLELREQQRHVDPVEGAPREAVTVDGHRCLLQANVELPSELDGVKRFGASGIGLYRSEYLYLNALPGLPSEEEQVRIYEQLGAISGDDGATVRSCDLGGEKAAPDGGEPERNPALGLRGVRLSFKTPDVFRTQLRAVLRASAKGRLRIVLPMVSRVSEVRAARDILEECKDELRAEGRPFDPKIPLGAMIEVPSAAFIADHLAAECDFFSIGTNDLIQYLLAVDRTNKNVAYVYEPLHPSVLRCLERVATIARENGVPTVVCGEMASNPLHVLVLLGLGYDCFSLAPSLLPLVRTAICSIDLEKARQLAGEILTMRSAQDIAAHISRELPEKFPVFLKG